MNPLTELVVSDVPQELPDESFTVYESEPELPALTEMLELPRDMVDVPMEKGFAFTVFEILEWVFPRFAIEKNIKPTIIKIVIASNLSYLFIIIITKYCI